MFIESSNTKFHWIQHNNGRVRTHTQCQPKLHLLTTKTNLCSNLQNFTFLLSKHFVINKNVSVDVFDRLLTITSDVRLSVISEIDVNNGCILLYAGVTLVLAVAYLALVFEETGLQIVPLVNKCKIIERDDVISFVDVTSNTVPPSV